MDKFKSLSTNQLLGIIFVILALVATYPSWSGYLKIGDRTPKDVDLSSYNDDRTQRIIIKTKDASVTLQQANNEWKVGDAPASNQELQKFFEALNTLQIQSVVSENSDNYAKYNVTEDTGTLVDLSANAKETKVIVGKAGAGFNTFYMRNIDGSKVYLMEGTLANVIPTSADAWRNKDIVSINKDNVQKIEVAFPDKNFSLIKENNTWKKDVTGTKTDVSNEKSDEILKMFNPLTGVGFLQAEEVAEFTSLPQSKIILSTADQPITIIFAEKDNSYWVNKEGDNTYYLLNQSTIAPLLAL